MRAVPRSALISLHSNPLACDFTSCFMKALAWPLKAGVQRLGELPCILLGMRQTELLEVALTQT